MRAVTDAEFPEVVLGSSRPVLVDFWAPWCTYCTRMEPVLEAIAHDFADSLDVVSVNVDETVRTPAMYSVSTLPTLMLFRGGDVVKILTGAQSRETVEAALRDASVSPR